MGRSLQSWAAALAAAILMTGCAAAEQGPLGWLGFREPGVEQWRVDVNTASVQELALLPGVGPQLAQNIVQYRQRQGIIEDADELRNVQGMTPEILDAIRDQVVTGKLDLNQATAEQLMRAPGIGPRLAEDIVLYRQRFGRFTNWDEVEKVHGVNRQVRNQLDEVAYLGRLNINAATVDELAQLPGMDRRIATNIVEFRNRAGRFTSTDELLQVQGMDRNRLNAIREHVVLGPMGQPPLQPQPRPLQAPPQPYGPGGYPPGPWR